MVETGKKEAEIILIVEEIIFQRFVMLSLVVIYIRNKRRAFGKKITGKKRRFTNDVDPIYELLSSYCQNTDARLRDIAKRIGYEYDISNARKKVFAAVDNIAGLTLHEKILASSLLVKEDGDLILFFSLPDDVKVKFVKMILAGHL